MKKALVHIITFFLFAPYLFAQDVYEIDPKYPVHDLNTHLRVYADSLDSFSPEYILRDSTMRFQKGNELPRFLNVGTTYWGKLNLIAKDSLKGWTLHFEDKMIGPPAWTKSNGKIDVYAYSENSLLFHKKTGVEYSKNKREIKANWVLNRIRIDELPPNESVTLIIKAQGNSIGYPAYFNLSARSSNQAFYHQIYQFNNSFNIFMFGVTFIIFLFHLLQFVYSRQRIFFWFSLWLLFCMLTQAMTIGLVIGSISEFRYPVWMLIANGIYFTFWFFGRSFVESKKKFPVLDKFMLGIALFILAEIIIMTSYVIIFNPQTYFTSVGIHYQLLSIYTMGSLILSIILSLKKDLFARYFGIGSLIASLSLIIGTLYAMGIIKSPIGLDPFVTGMFLQITIYAFGIAYRQQKVTQQAQKEKLQSERSLAEIQRMKDLDEVKTRFFANISHEFRTPLTLINGPLQQAKKLSSDKHSSSLLLSEKSFGVIKKNTARLQMLVDQLLDLSKIESGSLHLSLTTGGLIQFIRSQVFSFESMAERQNISLNTHFTEEIDTAYYDKDKLEKILNNLLSNAFKYTSRGGAVNVTIDNDANNVFIEIGDTGNGISKEEIERIFDRFYQVEGTEAKGSGIGLALTKELVDLHNGQISVHSDKGRGTMFKVRLPITLEGLPDAVVVQKESEEKMKAPDLLVNTFNENDKPKSATNNENAVVLVVEDNQDLQEFVSEILQNQYQVLTASDGLQGERMAFEHIPDLVISDVMMPKKDGYELCHILKHNIKTSHVPIIMLTAKAGQLNKIEGLTQGADAYLTKPFDEDELLLRVKNLIDARKKIWEHFKFMDLALIDDLNLKSAEDTFLQKVIKTIKDNLDNELLSVEDIAAKVGFSRAQLHRKLKALTNKSAGQLVNEIRLNEAKRMLENKIGSVSEIAYSVGYSNMSYFTKSFKEKFGVLPSKI